MNKKSDFEEIMNDLTMLNAIIETRILTLEKCDDETRLEIIKEFVTYFPEYLEYLAKKTQDRARYLLKQM